jgi:2-aminoadipate transaminase
MGVTMPLERRKAVYEIAKKHGLLILEDNPYGELTFDGTKVPTIKSMDTDGIVVYCGSFSKILAPGLRVGFVCGPAKLLQKLTVAKQGSDVHTPMITQLLAHEFMKRYDIDALIVEMRHLYRHKCQVMLDAIEQYFPAGVTHTTPNGGLFVWCDLGEGVDTQKLAAAATARKVVYVPGATFMTDMSKPCTGLRLNFSTMPDERIVEGIRILGEVFHDALKK